MQTDVFIVSSSSLFLKPLSLLYIILMFPGALVNRKWETSAVFETVCGHVIFTDTPVTWFVNSETTVSRLEKRLSQTQTQATFLMSVSLVSVCPLYIHQKGSGTENGTRWTTARCFAHSVVVLCPLKPSTTLQHKCFSNSCQSTVPCDIRLSLYTSAPHANHCGLFSLRRF